MAYAGARMVIIAFTNGNTCINFFFVFQLSDFQPPSALASSVFPVIVQLKQSSLIVDDGGKVQEWRLLWGSWGQMGTYALIYISFSVSIPIMENYWLAKKTLEWNSKCIYALPTNLVQLFESTIEFFTHLCTRTPHKHIDMNETESQMGFILNAAAADATLDYVPWANMPLLRLLLPLWICASLKGKSAATVEKLWFFVWIIS